VNRNPEVRSVSACFPCYNDAQTIATMVRDVRDVLDPLVDELEIVVVDDGSSDGSPDVLKALTDEVPELVVVVHEHNRGYGGALISAFSTATKDWIFYTDGDAQYDAKEAAGLVAAVTPTTDIVQGYKISRGDSWYRKVIGRVYHHVVKLAFGLRVRDTDCDFRLFRRSLIEASPLQSQTGVICVEMMRRFETAGARFVEVPVHHYARPHGSSQFFRVPHIARAALQLSRLWVELVVRKSR
jgi:glycosyltransferase involved in cell wall biosynthesis